LFQKCALPWSGHTIRDQDAISKKAGSGQQEGPFDLTTSP
jgi:hypothetical protein